MPVFRYFLVMGCCLLGLLLAADWIWPGDTASGAHPTAVATADATSAGLQATGLQSVSSDSKVSSSRDLSSKDLSSKDSSKNPTATDSGTESTVLSSIDDWRRSEERFERSKQNPQPIVYPDVATLAPTPDRLQWERQLRYLPADHVYEARAEMPKATAAESPKVAEKTAPPRKHVAHIRSKARIADDIERAPPRYARNSAWNPFGFFD
jgi:hypothetical protein